MATIKDVASRAGVAPSTVSYVLSGSRRISDRTRLAVEQAIEELGYHPSASARTLRSARTQVLALALPRSGANYRPTDGRFAIEICDAARAHGYDVLMLTEREGLPGLRRIARGGQADGAVLMAVTVDDPRVAALRELELPFALLGTELPVDAPLGAGAPFADLDWAAAVRLALIEAARAGHREIGYLPCTEREIADRKGYALRGLAGAGSAADSLAARRAGPEERGRDGGAGRAGGAVPEPAAGRRVGGEPATAARVRILDAPGEAEPLYARLRALLTAPDRPTALVVQHMAGVPTVLAAAEACGLRVPEDLCVLPVGSLPDDFGGRRLPRIELPVPEMAAAVTGLVVAALAAGAAGADTPPGHHLIAPVLRDAELLRRPGTARPAPHRRP